MITKYIIVFLLTIGTVVSAVAQAPYINSISPTSAGVGQVVNITGTNLDGVTKVYFGGALVTIPANVNENLITVSVPFGATFDQIALIHPTNGQGYSPQKFIPTFDGQSVTDGSNVLSNLSSQEAFPTGKMQTQDLCLCDFDLDGDLDVVASNAGANDILVFTNTSIVGNADFTSTTLANSFPVTNVICGDLDGDGFPDLIANELGGQARIYTYRNNQVGGFDAKEQWTLPTSGGLFRKPGRIAIGDLDLDGLPEIVVATEDENKVFFFENTSGFEDVNFNTTPLSLSADENAGSSGLGGLDIADLNNDGLPEIITSNFTESGYYVFQNNSEPGTFTFRAPLFVGTESSIRALITGDINNDGFADVVLTNSDIGSSDIIEISANSTTAAGSDISMTAPISILGIRQSWGLDLGDIDGDNDLDIIIGSEIENGFYAIMNNNPSTIAVASYSVGLVAQSNMNNARNIKVADMDADGRPDFVYTNNSKATANGNIAIRLNEICFTPKIRPTGSTVLCENESVDLVATLTGYPTSYVWRKDGGAPLTETSNTLTLTEGDLGLDGDYTVEISDGCQTASASINVTDPGEAFNAPTTSILDAPCAGDNVNLTATPGGATVAYVWTGPNGYTSTTQNPTISNITSEHSGEYFVTATSGAGCQKSSAIEVVTVVTTPIVSVNNPKPDYFCNGNDLDLSTNDFGADFTYDWKLNDVSTGGTNPTSYVNSSAGDISVTITETASGCSYTSAHRTLTTVAPPTSAFTPSDSTICEDVEVTFTANSTGAAGLTIVNHWDFKDGTDVGGQVKHAFGSANSYLVELTAKYEGIDDLDCTYTPADSTLKVVSPPTDLDLIISDNSDPNNFEKCSESALTLRVEDNYLDYEWKVGTNTVSTIAIAEISEEQAVFATLTDSVKCTFDTNPVDVTNYTTGGISISAASPNTTEIDVNLGKIVNMEEGQSSVTLMVENATSPAWEPALYIDDTTATSIVVSVSNKQLITVYGIDNLGCQEKDSVTLILPGVQAAKSFTPNGDGIGDCWEVSNIGGTDCQVVIFDSKGRRIRDLSFSPDGGADDCVWDGSKSNGSALPDGMYYYFISCSDSGNESSGSIFMAR